MNELVPERFLWALETLGVAPPDHVLEIGCGHGIALSMLFPKLTEGFAYGIDRSETMARAAAKRNRAAIEAGRVRIAAAELTAGEHLRLKFSRVFAINVDLFRDRPEAEANAIRRMLTPEGALYLFMQPPVAGKARLVAERWSEALERLDFRVESVAYRSMEPAEAACLIARPRRPAGMDR
jgi:SAM-dependent methyltransferase